MLVVTRANCTQVNVEEEYTFTFDPVDGFTGIVNQTSLPYQAYRGTDNSNNDLGALWSSSTSMETFLRNNNCLAVRDELFASKYNIDTASWTCVIGLGKFQ